MTRSHALELLPRLLATIAAYRERIAQLEAENERLRAAVEVARDWKPANSKLLRHMDDALSAPAQPHLEKT